METPKKLNTPVDSVPRPPDVSGGEGGGNDSVRNLADVVNEAFGTTFKDDTSALQGLKDTAVMRGKLGKFRPFIESLEKTKGGEQQALQFMEDLTKTPEVAPVVQPIAAPVSQPAIDASKFVPVEKYEKDNFFSANPSLAKHEELLSALKMANPTKKWDELKDLPAFKPVLDAESFRDSRVPLTSSSRVYTETPASQTAEKFSEAMKLPGGAKRADAFAKNAIESGQIPIPPSMEDFANGSRN